MRIGGILTDRDRGGDTYVCLGRPPEGARDGYWWAVSFDEGRIYAVRVVNERDPDWKAVYTTGQAPAPPR